MIRSAGHVQCQYVASADAQVQFSATSDASIIYIVAVQGVQYWTDHLGNIITDHLGNPIEV